MLATFSIAMITPHKKPLKEGRFILDHKVISSVMVGKAWRQEETSHIVTVVWKQSTKRKWGGVITRKAALKRPSSFKGPQTSKTAPVRDQEFSNTQAYREYSHFNHHNQRWADPKARALAQTSEGR